MINRCFFAIAGFFGLIALLSCERGDQAVGANFFDPQGGVVEIDTITLNFSSFLLDSVKTSNTDVALVGLIEDADFGKISSRSYIMFGRPSVTQLSEDAVFDSLVLGFAYTGYYYGDTTGKLEFNIYRLTEKVECKESDTYLYNTSSFKFDEKKAIGHFSVVPKPLSKVNISTHLDASLGKEFVEILKKNNNDLTSSDNFVDYFNGIVLVANSSKSIVGLDVNDTSMFLKLYYHLPNEVENESEVVVATPYKTSLQFNQIISDRTGKVTGSIGLTPTSSLVTGDYSYVQGGTGIVSRVDIPSLTEVLKARKNLHVIKAELVVQPCYTVEKDLPEVLNLYYTNKHNDFLQKISTSEGTALDGNLSIDYINRENTTYSWDITMYVKTVLGDNTSNLKGLLIVPEDYATGFDHVAIADQLKSKYRTKLKLYTVTYE